MGPPQETDMQQVQSTLAIEAIRSAVLDVNLKAAILNKVRTMRPEELAHAELQFEWFRGVLLDYMRQQRRR